MPLMTVHEVARRLEGGELSSREVVAHYLGQIENVNDTVNAFVTVLGEEALAAADESDARRQSGRARSPLDGVPVLLKDNICKAGTLTTCGSRILANFRPPYDATVTRKLADAGMVILGKANMDEFAMGSSNEQSAHGPVHNPWNPAFVPGGSSGGSAAAVAAGMTPAALGSDTGGSIRQPAGFCGVVGLKPTYGRVSRYGLVAFASSLDQIGPLTVDVEDTALMLGAIAGHDPRDSTSSEVPAENYHELLQKGSLKGLRVGRPVDFFEVDGLDAEVAAACRQALIEMEKAGAQIVDVSMPHAAKHAISTYYVLATAEASSNLARFDGAHYGFRAEDTKDIVEMYSRTRAAGFGDEVKRRIMLGTFVLAAETFDAYYVRAQKVRTLIKRDYDQAFEKVDVIAAPTAPSPAFRIGDKIGDPMQMYLSDIFTLSLNLAGYCGLSMPVGHTDAGLPLGMQLFAGPYQETKLLQAAWQLEQALGIVNRRTAPLAG